MNGGLGSTTRLLALIGLALAFSATGLAEAVKGTSTMGPLRPLEGPRVIPNLALRTAPKTDAARHPATHEGPEYWKAKRTDAYFEESHENLPPDFRRALAESVYKRREAARRSREALASVGWKSLGPSTDAGRVRDYEFTPDGSSLYVATANGGIWLLTRQGGPGSDYGNPRPLTEDLPTLTFGSIAVAPSNPSIVYAATGEQAFYSGSVVRGFGTIKSTDGGNTWKFNTVSVTGRRTSALVPGEFSHDLSVNPANADDVLLANENGIFRSTDGGATWVNKLEADDKRQRAGVNLVRRPDNPSAIFAGLWGGLAGSFDGGETWQVVFENLGEMMGVQATPIRSLVAVAPSNPNRVYWLVASSTPNGYSQLGFFRSDDGGAHFCPDGINSATGVPCIGPPAEGQQGYPDIAGQQGWTFLSLAVDPTNPNRVIAGGLDTWRSDDGGRNWMQMSQWTLPERHPQFCHADIDTLAFEPGRPTFWVGSDGGLFRSLDARTFVWKNDGVVARMFSSLAQHPTDRYRIFAGTQDNGTNRLTANNPAAWQQVHRGDGYDCVVNPQNPSIVYATNYNDYTNRSTNGGEPDSFQLTNCSDSAQTLKDCNLPPVTSFRSRLGMDPVNPKVLYAMTDRLYTTTDGASSPEDWKPVYRGYFCSDGYSETVDCPDAQKNYASNTSISVNPRDGGRVALGTRAGYVLYTLNGFQNGQLLGVGGQINAIVWDPNDSNALILGLEAPSEGHTIWRAGNLDQYIAGTGNVAWRSMDDGLQVPVTYAGGSSTYSLPVDSLAVSPVNASLWFAGTKYGVYRSTNGGSAWVPFGDEFPATWVSALLFTPDGALVRAATWGRGLWEVNPLGGAPPGPTSAPSAAFRFSPASPRPGQTVGFFDESTGGATSWSWSFGDGGSSTEQNPTHVYAGEGSFGVTLTATNSAGSRTATKQVPVSFGSTGTGDAFTYLFPVVLTVSGAGGEQFATEVSLTNRSGKTLNLTFRVKGTFEASSTYSLPPGQQIHPDVFAFLKSQTGMSVPAGNVLGTLRIEVRGADNLSQFGALARVTTPPTPFQAAAGIRGRFGLSFPASPLGRGAKTEAIVYALQDTSDPGQAGTRSNLACVNAGGGTGSAPLVLEVVYHDGCPGYDTDDCGVGIESPVKDSFSLSRFAFDQKNRPLKAGGRFIRWGYATIRRVSGDDEFVCYGVLNDNLNGDGAFVPMVDNDVPSPTSDAMVPVILDLGSRFKSEVTIANRTARTISALFAVIKAGDPTPEWGYINYPPGIQITASDIGQVLRDVGFTFPEGTVASLYMQFLEGEFVDSQSDTQPTIPTSEGYFGVRTYAPGPGGSLFGLAYGYSPVGTAADTEAYVYGLQQTGVQGQGAGTRSNLAVVHALGGGIEPITLEITYYDASGRELTPKDTKTLQAGEWYQFNAPLAARGAAGGFARVRRVAGNDQFIVYGVLNDQLNGDGSFVPMVVP